MKIIVSGGDGFIGKNLVERLHQLGNEVIVIDNHITSYKENDNLLNVIHIDESIENINIDSYEGVDIIFHLASVASPLVYKKDFKNVYNPNVKGTEVLIELAKKCGSKLIYTSTSEVYGTLNDQLTNYEGIKENTVSLSHLLTDRSIYPTSKKMGEELVNNYIRNGGTGLILRLFNVYGPNMDVRNNGYGRVIPNFINAISNNQELTIYGDGNQIRSFVWIEDLIDALINLMNYEGDNKILNIGNPTETSINDLAKTLFRITGKNPGIRYLIRDIDDPLWRRPNTTVVEKSINWKPKVSLLKGLKRIIGVDYE